jgi:hypothetical protein
MTRSIPFLISAPAVLAFTILAFGAGPARAAAPADTGLHFLNHPGWSGVGVAIGNVATGVTGKVWLSPKLALQGIVGDGPLGNNLRANFDLTFGVHEWRSPDNQYALNPYLGIGGAIGHSFASGDRPGGTEAGFRVPAGMSIFISDNPVEVYFEVAPEFTVRDTPVLGRFTFYADGAIGVRWYP